MMQEKIGKCHGCRRLVRWDHGWGVLCNGRGDVFCAACVRKRMAAGTWDGDGTAERGAKSLYLSSRYAEDDAGDIVDARTGRVAYRA